MCLCSKVVFGTFSNLPCWFMFSFGVHFDAVIESLFISSSTHACPSLPIGCHCTTIYMFAPMFCLPGKTFAWVISNDPKGHINFVYTNWQSRLLMNSVFRLITNILVKWQVWMFIWLKKGSQSHGTVDGLCFFMSIWNLAHIVKSVLCGLKSYQVYWYQGIGPGSFEEMHVLTWSLPHRHVIQV